MTALSLRNVTKRYPAFTLNQINLSVEEGRVCGLIGANGAGKSTLLKSVAGLIKAEGEIEIFSLPAHSAAAKALVGYAGGGFRYYAQKRVKTLAAVVAGFYPTWNEKAFQAYLARFGISPEKKIAALSEGMKVKLSLALALSRGARLLVLDEPTSGLDPLSREELCGEIDSLAKHEGVAVLFSTHISSDLTRAADDIVLLSNGRILRNEPLKTLLNAYSLAVFPTRERAEGIGIKEGKEGFSALVPRGFSALCAHISDASLDDIITHLEYERRETWES